LFSSACVAIASLGSRAGGNRTVGLLAAFVYATQWTAVNSTLGAGIVDSAEIAVFSSVLLAVASSKWRFAPLLVLVGALAKETVVLFAGVFLLSQIAFALAKGRRVPRAWIASALLAAGGGAAVIVAVRAMVGGNLYEAHTLSLERVRTLLLNLKVMVNHEPLLAIVPLLLLGVFRLTRIPRALLVGSAAVALTVIAAGAYAGIGPNIGRALFNTVGPVLAISGAMLVYDRCVAPRGA
jgi:hypothetical protein